MTVFPIATTSVDPTLCFISKTISGSVDNKEPAQVSNVLNDLKQVPVYKNLILNAIMQVRDVWDSNPIIYVNNQPYLVKLVQQTDKCALLYQMHLKAGYGSFKVNNTRQVLIYF